MSMAINFGRVEIYNKEFPSIKSSNPLITLSYKVTETILAAVSLLPQGLWPLNLAKWWLAIRKLNPLSQKTL